MFECRPSGERETAAHKTKSKHHKLVELIEYQGPEFETINISSLVIQHPIRIVSISLREKTTLAAKTFG